MARERTFEIAAINVTMHPHTAAKYVDLLNRVVKSRMPAQIRGDYHAMIATARPVHDGSPERGLTGEIYKFFELDSQLEWFNVIRLKAADPEERRSIRIPSELKPHFSSFYYVFFPQGHRLFFECKHGAHQLSPGAAAKMLASVFEQPAIERDFGHVDVTVEPKSESLDRILQMPRLHRLRIEITRPNADDLGSARRKMMDRLNRMHARSEVIVLTGERKKGLDPDEDIRTTARIAQSNGNVEAEGYGDDGKPVFESTHEHPRKEIVKYDPSVEDPRERLIGTAAAVLREITSRERGGGKSQ